MTEKLFTRTLSKKKKKKTCEPELARTPGLGPSVCSSFFSENWENIPHKNFVLDCKT